MIPDAPAAHAAPRTRTAEPGELGVDGPPLRIALLGYRSNPHSGGQGVYLRHLSRALRDLGHGVTVVSGPPYPDLAPGIELVRLPSLDLYAQANHIRALRPRHLRSLTDTWEWFSMATGGFPEPYTFGRRLVRWMREQGRVFDVVHDNQSLCWGLLDLQRMGLPVVATIHHPIHRDLEIALGAARSWQHRLLIRRWHGFLGMQNRVAARLRHVVTVSQAARQDILDCFPVMPEAVTVVENGIDTRVFHPEPDIPRIPGRLMATASADQPLKGLVHLLEAVGRLRRQGRDVTLTVLGRLREDGPTARRLRELSLGEAVRFRSGLQEAEIRRLYAEAEVVVVPSIYEGFGLPAGEAMACAVPVVSTTGGALPEVVGDAGVLVPPGDPDAIVTAVSALLDDPARRAALGAAGLARIRDHFAWDRAACRLTAYYRSLVS